MQDGLSQEAVIRIGDARAEGKFSQEAVKRMVGMPMKLFNTTLGTDIVSLSVNRFFAVLSGEPLQISALAAEHSKLVPAAPVPPQIVAAKKVFVANAGGDERWYEKPMFSGGPSRAYNQFYAAVKNAGRYEIVDSPADAELIFEIGLTAPLVSVRGDVYDPQIRLAIRDPKTTALLWAFTEHVQLAILKETRNNNFDQSMAELISDLQGLSASSNNAQKP